MLLEGTVEGPLAGKAAGESDLKNALIGGSQKILRVIQAQKIDIIVKAGMQSLGKYMGQMIFTYTQFLGDGFQ